MSDANQRLEDLVFIFDEIAKEYNNSLEYEENEYLRGKAEAYERVVTILGNVANRKEVSE